MATVYRFEVKVVSPFCSYEPEFIQKVIEKQLEVWESYNGNKLESIEVKNKGHHHD